MKPNILFIAVDDLRCELGCYGKSQVISPHIDELAASGTVFEYAFCQSGVCNPSRASLMTGLRPDSTRVWDLWTHFRDTIPDVVTLPQYFSKHGYYCNCIGKIYHNNLLDPDSWSEPRHVIPGFPYDPDCVYRDDENVRCLELRKKEITDAGNAERHLDRFGEWYIKAEAHEMPDVSDDAYYDGAQTEVAMAEISDLAAGDTPFFFGIGYYRPHLPFNVPKRYWDLYERESIELAENDYPPTNMPHMAINNMRELRGYNDYHEVEHPLVAKLDDDNARLLKHGYLASVSYVDAQVGKLLSHLEDLGIAENTIVVLWGDNGYKLGEHGSWCKMTNFEWDTHVPLIIKSPGLHGRRQELVEFVDIYPTLCELSGLPVPGSLEGESLVPLMKDQKAKGKGAAYSQFLRSRVFRDPDGRDYMGYAVRTGAFRYVEWYAWESKEFAARELYDHRLDHGENENIVDKPDFADVIRDHAGLLRGVFSHL